ncbi:MAG: methylenetetrahydrofolate reductase [NAD(P)H] [Planctomycetota bacterium]|jgi:methylenetetrahydrofolate reductase (NADPH)
MKIKDMFHVDGPVISFEFFPPKTDEGTEALYHTVETLGPCKPSFVSVTYGAGGSTRDRTLSLVARIKRDIGLEAMAHLTCVGSSKEQIRKILSRLQDAGIDNVLALRGDPPAGETDFVQAEGGFGYANELVSYIREQGFEFCLGGACYPEKHTESPDPDVDLSMTQQKVDAGLDFLVTQLFFENSEYFAYVERARRAGIQVPIVPGLMPITNVAQVQRFTKMCGASIPEELSRRLHIVEDDPSAVVATGVNWAIEQCRELLERGVPGLHFYTLNKSSATLAVHAALGL